MIGRFWRLIFPPRPETLLSRLEPRAPWLAVHLNTHAYLDYFPNTRMETPHWSVAFGRKGEEGRWDLWRDGSHAGGRHFTGTQGAGALWLFTHLAVNEALTGFKARASAPVAGQTAPMLQNESRSLEWLRTSLRVLYAALESCRTGPDRVVVGTLWLGEKEPGRALVRLVCFNLDLTAHFRDDGMLTLLVFDDKDKGAGSSQNPALQAEFATLKAPVLDELIKLAAAMVGAAERK